MSHKASHWLATIPADAINNGAFRVLFHLCDAHNSQRDPQTACFPGQKRLRASTGLSNGGLNNALNALEAANLIRRRRTRNADGTRGPTYYILGCDGDFTQAPPPKNGDGNDAQKVCSAPVENSSTSSKSKYLPSPKSGPSHLQWSGDNPLKEPVNEPLRARVQTSELVENKPRCSQRRTALVAEMAKKYPSLIRPPPRIR